MNATAPAKINLHLRVGPPRADGFHPLVSWMCTVGLFDMLRVHPAPGGQVRLVCTTADVPCDSRNLVVKAAAALADALAEEREGRGLPDSGLSVELLKQIPIGAGLGGGSSDGACMLRVLNALWSAGLDRARLAELGARLGSDVSFFFYAPSALCRGRGEIVTPISAPRPPYAVLIFPGRPVATPAVYRLFDEMSLGRQEAIENVPDFAAWAGLPAAELLPRLVNDLEAAAFALDSDLGKLRQDLEHKLARIVRMSGSGSTLFTLFDAQDEADAAAERIWKELHVKTSAVRLAPTPAGEFNASAGQT